MHTAAFAQMAEALARSHMAQNPNFNQAPAPFPEEFASRRPHMTLIKITDGCYLLEPPNQLDWSYTITKLSGAEWRVQGRKQDYDVEETCDDVYMYKYGTWVLESCVGDHVPDSVGESPEQLARD